MPIFRYFVVMGAALFGLLLLADANLPPPGPLANSTNFYGLGRVPASPKVTHFAAMAAPEPDMTSAAVLAAEPAPPVAAAPSAQASPNPVAKPEPHKKRKRVAHKRNLRHDYAEANPWAWRPNNQTRFW